MIDLKRATLLATVAICWGFGYRTAATLSPFLLNNLETLRVTAVLDLLAAVAITLFFVVFAISAARWRRQRLKETASWAAAGAVAMLLLRLHALESLWLTHFGPWPSWPDALNALVPLAAGIASLTFLVTLYRDLGGDERAQLGRSTRYGIAGVSLFVVLHLVALGNYLTSGVFHWISALDRTVIVITLPLFVIAFAMTLIFFVALYRCLPRDGSGLVDRVEAERV